MDSPVVQTVIGLVFVFAVGAGLVSLVTESIGRYIGLRAEYLLRGLRTLLDGNGEFKLPFWRTLTGTLSSGGKDQQGKAVDAFQPLRASVAPAAPAAPPAPASPSVPAVLSAPAPAAQADSSISGKAMVALILAHPLVGATSLREQNDRAIPAGDAPMTNRQRRALPAYISGRTFSRALVDLLVPDADDTTTMTEIKAGIEAVSNPQLRGALGALANDVDEGISTFRTNVEHWYDDQMARVSGWYKRHTRWISLGISLILVLAFNLNVLTMAHTLFSDQAVSAAVVSEATNATKCQADNQDCWQELTGDISSVRAAGLPVGWATVPACALSGAKCNWAETHGLWLPKVTSGNDQESPSGVGQTLHLLTLVLGWLLMIIALLPGANFWFDILGRLGTLRNTGPKPASS